VGGGLQTLNLPNERKDFDPSIVKTPPPLRAMAFALTWIDV